MFPETKLDYLDPVKRAGLLRQAIDKFVVAPRAIGGFTEADQKNGRIAWVKICNWTQTILVSVHITGNGIMESWSNALLVPDYLAVIKTQEDKFAKPRCQIELREMLASSMCTLKLKIEKVD